MPCSLRTSRASFGRMVYGLAPGGRNLCPVLAHQLLESRIPTQRRKRRVDAQPRTREIVGALQELLEDVHGPILMPGHHGDAGLQLVEIRGSGAVLLVRRLDRG